VDQNGEGEFGLRPIPEGIGIDLRVLRSEKAFVM
jgi:hypothetical protein